jgi:hypothetical protein
MLEHLSGLHDEALGLIPSPEKINKRRIEITYFKSLTALKF